MPLFTFTCPGCGTTKETVLKHSERDSHQEGCLACQRIVSGGAKPVPPVGGRVLDYAEDPTDFTTEAAEERSETPVGVWRVQFLLVWAGVEGSQAVRMNGKYQFQLKDSAGGVVVRKPPDRGF